MGFRGSGSRPRDLMLIWLPYSIAAWRKFSNCVYLVPVCFQMFIVEKTSSLRNEFGPFLGASLCCVQGVER